MIGSLLVALALGGGAVVCIYAAGYYWRRDRFVSLVLAVTAVLAAGALLERANL